MSSSAAASSSSPLPSSPGSSAGAAAAHQPSLGKAGACSSSSGSGAGPTTTSLGIIKGGPSQYVKLNVGGYLHYTTIGTLTKHDTMLRAMFSGRMEVLSDSEGWILVDRCGRHFNTLLNFLRDGTVALPETRRDLSELQAEAKFFLIEELDEACEKALKTFRDRDEDVVPICRVPLITSTREEQALISTNSTKPIVKLLINRHNNKYSYTGASDDNILKNIELFDKLSLRFSNRILFIKDVIGSNEICCWSFYGNGKKIAEVCCTAIVYATDRKNTKVEFPEARIYEETLSCLLYENSNLPDPELIYATQKRRPISDDEEEKHGAAVGGAKSDGGASGGAPERSGAVAATASAIARMRSSKNN